jgi:hypothetical protein
MRLGSEIGGCGESDAMLKMRREEVHATRVTAAEAPRIYILA